MITNHRASLSCVLWRYVRNLKLKSYLRQRVLHFRDSNPRKSRREDIPVSLCAIFQVSDEVSNKAVLVFFSSHQKAYILVLFYYKIKADLEKPHKGII